MDNISEKQDFVLNEGHLVQRTESSRIKPVPISESNFI